MNITLTLALIAGSHKDIDHRWRLSYISLLITKPAFQGPLGLTLDRIWFYVIAEVFHLYVVSVLYWFRFTLISGMCFSGFGERRHGSSGLSGTDGQRAGREGETGQTRHPPSQVNGWQMLCMVIKPRIELHQLICFLERCQCQDWLKTGICHEYCPGIMHCTSKAEL